MDIKKEVILRTKIIYALALIGSVLIFSRAVYINVAEGDKWREQRKKNTVKYISVAADRGNILADDGTLLATSLQFFDVRMDFRAGGLTKEVFNKNVDSLAILLSAHIFKDMSKAAVKNLLIRERKAGDRYFLIKKDVTYDELELIKSFPMLRMGANKGGLILEKKSKREMPFQMLAYRTIGSTRDSIKYIGLEGTCNKVLTGESGKKLMQKIQPGNIWIPINDLTEIKPKNGADVLTTLNINLQDIAENALLKALQKHNADHGSVIVMDVKTGAIKAMANLGKMGDSYWEDYNYAIGASTEPGSTFKLATLMSLLEDGYIKLDDTVNLNYGQAQFANSKMHDSEEHNITWTTVQHAFEVSSNVGIAKVAVQHYGVDDRAKQFTSRLKKFGLDRKTGIELEGEGTPYIKDAFDKKENWSKTSLPWMAHGYEVQMTPLQILTFYNAIANNGVEVKPYLVQEYQQNGETIRRFDTTVINRNIASPATIAAARTLLEGVVTNGTAKSLRSPNYTFAGKTGTARIDYFDKNKKGNGKEFQASFVGYFPADTPIYSCIVVVSNPRQNGYYGGAVAGPVFKEIADNCYATLDKFHPVINKRDTIKELAINELPVYNAGLLADLNYISSHLGLKINNYNNYKSGKAGSEWAVVTPDSNKLVFETRPIQKGIVPNVKGMGLRDALYLLESKGLKVHVRGAGKVVQQSVEPGTTAGRQNIELLLE